MDGIFETKIWGMRVKLDDFIGAIVFGLAVSCLSGGDYSSVIVLSACSIASAAPEDDPARRWWEIIAGFALLFFTMMLLEIPIPIFKLAFVLDAQLLKWTLIAAYFSAIAGLFANLVEILPVVGKWLYETFHREAERSDKRREASLKRKLEHFK